jgi:orotate phosphoribosyltransferase-like protein
MEAQPIHTAIKQKLDEGLIVFRHQMGVKNEIGFFSQLFNRIDRKRVVGAVLPVNNVYVQEFAAQILNFLNLASYA